MVCLASLGAVACSSPNASSDASAVADGANAGSDGGSGADATVSVGPDTHDCAEVPSKCGYPDGTNTGPATGTTLQKVPSEVSSGPGWEWEENFRRLRVTGDGADLHGLDIDGPVVIDAPNVTLRDSIVTTCGSEGDIVAIRAGNPGNGYNGDSASILFNRLRCSTDGERARSGVRDVYGAAENLVVRGNDISGTGNGITIEKNGSATDNWIHDLGHLAGDHHSGLSNHGGASSVVFQHNTALLADTDTTGGGGLSGAITVYGDFARAQNVTIKDNLVSGGAYTFYGGINNEEVYGQPIEIHIDNNRLLCDSWDYGPVFRREGATNSFDGNFCDQDGSPIAP